MLSQINVTNQLAYNSIFCANNAWTSVDTCENHTGLYGCFFIPNDDLKNYLFMVKNAVNATAVIKVINGNSLFSVPKNLEISLDSGKTAFVYLESGQFLQVEATLEWNGEITGGCKGKVIFLSSTEDISFGCISLV